jgi:hypothetical protein
MKFLKLVAILPAVFILLPSCKNECPTPVPPVDLFSTTWGGLALINTIGYHPFIIAFNSNKTCNVGIGSFFPFHWHMQ